MPSVLDRMLRRKPQSETVKHEEPVPLTKVEEPMPEAPSESIKQPEVIEHGIPVEIPVKVEETKKEDFDA